ncbi:hypothetical protein [Streptomyces ardesiacus]
MSDYHALEPGTFVDDQGTVRTMVPSSVLAAVPEARAAAEVYGREVRFDFLDDDAVQWMLFQRREDTEKGSLLGCLLVVPLFVFGVGAWPFWDLVASQKSRQFQIVFIAVDALIVCAALLAVVLVRRRSLLDPVVRNVRCRARLYRKIVGIARKKGAEIPSLYPYYGMYATSRKFFPEAPERPMPEREESP